MFLCIIYSRIDQVKGHNVMEVIVIEAVLAIMISKSYLGEPGVAFCTAELKKASLKKSREPLKTTLALFLA